MARSVSILRAAVCWVGVAAMLWACGYHVAGKGALPGNARTIGVKVLTNRSIETGAEAILTNALTDELNRRRPGIIQRVGDADAVLAGTIVSIKRKTVARSGTLTATQERVTVEIALTLKDPSGKPLWNRSRMAAQEDYAVVAGDAMATLGNRRRAITKAAQRLAEDVYRGLTDNF
jgi:outer membrane lipopolysaccharide assembly protein LptE/RlpB